MALVFDRCWHLTWTTYGSWLPGDERGFVSPVPHNDRPPTIHNAPDTPHDADVPSLLRSAESQLKCDPVRLTLEQAQAVFAQLKETASIRNWVILAVAIMATHIHLLVGVPGDPDPNTLLRDFKSYASRCLNRGWDRPGSDTWWTESGSKRKKADDAAVIVAVEYIRNQEYPLLVWVAPEFNRADR